MDFTLAAGLRVWLLVAGVLGLGCSYRPLPRLVDRGGVGGAMGGFGGSAVGGGTGGDGSGGTGTDGTGSGGTGSGGTASGTGGTGSGGSRVGGSGGSCGGGAASCCQEDSDCPGECQACTAGHACVAATGGDDPTGRCSGTCDAAGVCRSKRGQRCDGNERGCVAGSSCSLDGICCDQPCAESCLACDVPGQEGTCTPVASGPPHFNHNHCMGEQSLCAGSCAGRADGECVYLANPCGVSSCSGSTFVGQGLCDSAGACVPTSTACGGGYVCAGGVCLTGCNSDDDCAPSYSCALGSCLPGAVAIASGTGHTCALLVDGSVRCWGSNRYGQLGNGTTVDSPAPVSVIGLGGIATSIAAGGGHTCALLADGSLQCWGANVFGELGDGTNVDSPAPVSVIDLEAAAISIALGVDHTCALLSNDRISCWGSNQLCGVSLDGSPECQGDISGQLGNGTSIGSTKPVPLLSMVGDPISLAAGSAHTCALVVGGSVWCWGDNVYGDLGNGGTDSSSIPIDVGGLPAPATAIAAGPLRTCAVLADGSVDCWGYFFVTPRPEPLNGLAGVTAIALGLYHECAVLADGSVRCAGGNGQESGTNTYGQLGNGTTTDSVVPVSVTGLAGSPPVASVSAGLYHTCALLADGGVRCWGNNSLGQLGNDSNTDSAVPVDVVPW